MICRASSGSGPASAGWWWFRWSRAQCRSKCRTSSARPISMTDFMGMMKQAAQLQSKMQELQAELDQITIEGTAGGGMVTVTLTGKGDLKAVKLDDSLIKPGEKEILEDLLVAA